MAFGGGDDPVHTVLTLSSVKAFTAGYLARGPYPRAASSSALDRRGELALVDAVHVGKLICAFAAALESAA